MPQMITVETQPRGVFGKNASRRMRSAGLIPATVYGLYEDPVSLSVDPKVMYRILHSSSGQNTLFELAVHSRKNAYVLIKDFQRDPVKGNLLHIDFLRIDMTKKLIVQVPLEIVGVPIGVKTHGGIMDLVVREVEIECLPGDIPETIPVHVAELGLNDILRVSQVQAPDKIKILTEPEVVLVTVLPQRVEEAPVEAVPVEAGTEPEVIKKGKAATEKEGEKE